jgi:hypothetical protein
VGKCSIPTRLVINSRWRIETRNCRQKPSFYRQDLLRKTHREGAGRGDKDRYDVMVDRVERDPKFKLIGSDGLFSGLRHLRYGTGQNDPMPFTLTLTPQYVAREIRKTLPVSYLKVQRYAKRNADKLKAIAKSEKERGVNAHTLQ